MADILQGATSHTNFAPLSKDQTVKICQHLAEQIKEVSGKLNELQSTVGNQAEGLSSLRRGLEETNKELYVVQSGIDDFKVNVEHTKNDLGRTQALVQKLQSSNEGRLDDIVSLRESQKLLSTNMEKFSQDLQKNDEQTLSIQQDIERRIGTNFEKLQDQVGRLDLRLEQLCAYDEMDKVENQEQKEELRKHDTVMRNIRDDLTKTNTVLHMLEQQMTDSGSGLKGTLRDTRALLDETNASLSRLHEDHEHTKSHMQETQGGLRQAKEHMKGVTHSFEESMRSQQAERMKVESCGGVLASVRQTCESMQSKIRTLTEGQDMTNSTIRSIQQDLSETQQSGMMTRAALKETQTIVLPNLHMDMPHLQSSGGLGGSLTARPSTKHGPHIRRVQPALQSKSEDPNKMAWI